MRKLRYRKSDQLVLAFPAERPADSSFLGKVGWLVAPDTGGRSLSKVTELEPGCESEQSDSIQQPLHLWILPILQMSNLRVREEWTDLSTIKQLAGGKQEMIPGDLWMTSVLYSSLPSIKRVFVEKRVALKNIKDRNETKKREYSRKRCTSDSDT